MPDFVDKKQTSSCSQEFGRFAKQLHHPNVGLFNHIRGITISHGDISKLNPSVSAFVETTANLCQPETIHICDGSDTENNYLLKILQDAQTIVPLPKYENCWLAKTDPADTARVESRTMICTERREDTVTTPAPGVKGTLGNWISPADYENNKLNVFKGSMRGRTMFVIPYSMGPVGSPLSRIGIQCTDSAYVATAMRIMTRMGQAVLDALGNSDYFVKGMHSVGTPKDGKIKYPHWPCDPERTIIMHKPIDMEIASYGSGYGGNSLLGKKCFALRIGSTIAKREGWLAEHMLILGVTNPQGVKKYITAAFPSACGKTNLAMMTPTLPGYKVECVGDDIAWMRFDENGVLRAINPENGFFGVAPGTSYKSNPNAMKSIFKDCIFTNVASTSDGGVFWEGLEDETDFDKVQVTDWLGNPWKPGSKTLAAQANSRFCAPAKQCPIIDPAWEDPKGVPISAIIFGGRRPEGIPLVYQARNWDHGVYVGASIRSETTAAAEFKGKAIMHDPFAMRPFFGYNCGQYMDHWLSMKQKSECLPKIFHVNWFRKGKDGKFLWPGFGENIRVVDWILRRIEGEDCAEDQPLGLVPKKGSLNLDGLGEINTKELFSMDKQFLMKECDDIKKYFHDQIGNDLPEPIQKQLNDVRERASKL